jgi:hypothetical protein
MGLGNPCNELDTNLFAATIVMVGNGENAKFWNSPWIMGLGPRTLDRSSLRTKKGIFSWSENFSQQFVGQQYQHLKRL